VKRNTRDSISFLGELATRHQHRYHIITFLMVFLIQQSQNKDSVAVHLKLNELLAANREASNRMIGIASLDEQDLRDVATFYVKLAERAKGSGPNKEAHSIDEEGMPAVARRAKLRDATH
jgi:Low affinity iron permease